MDQAAAPVREQDRITSLDVLRGFALCGILLMNIPYMGDVYVTERPLTPQSLADPNWIVWIVGHLFVIGTMRGLFTLLFGAGVLLITARAMRPDGPVETADVYYRRALMLMALGVANFTVFLWPGEILFYYGMTSLFLFPLRKLKPAILLVLGLLLLGGNDAYFTSKRYETAQTVHAGEAVLARQKARQPLTAADKAAIAARAEAIADVAADPDEVKAEIAAKTSGSYLTVMGWSAKTWLEESGSFLNAGISEAAGAMLVGMALFKWGVLTGKRSIGFYLALAVVGYVVGVGVNGWGTLVRFNAHFYPVNWFLGLTYNLGRMGVTLGHLGLVLALWKAGALGIVGRAFANLGRMALTNYVGQSVIGAVLFYGLGLFQRFDWAQLWLIAAGIWIAQALFSAWWLQRYAMGPMEWLLRAVAYGRRPPLRRGTEAAPAAA